MTLPGGPTGWDHRVVGRVVPDGPERLPTTVDLLVVGLGTSGLEAVRHAAARGVDVVGVDAVGIAAGAAGRNGGFLLAGLADFHHDAAVRHGRDAAVRWFRRTEAELARVAEHHPDLVRRTGSLRIAGSPDEVEDIAAQLVAMRADGLTADAYDGPEGRGLLVPGDAAANPVARCHALAASAVTSGATLLAPARVRALEPHDGMVVVTFAGPDEPRTVHAGRVVVALDGGLERLLPELADQVRTSRLQMLATTPDPGVHLPRPVYHRWGYDYVQQLATGEVLVGGGRDLHADAEWGAPASTTRAVQTHLDAFADVLGVTATVTHRWAAHAAFTRSRLSIDGEVRPGVHAVGGHNGHGNLLGPMLARAAVDRCLDG